MSGSRRCGKQCKSRTTRRISSESSTLLFVPTCRQRLSVLFQQSRHSNGPGDHRADAEAIARDRGDAHEDAARSEDLPGQRQLTATVRMKSTLHFNRCLILFFRINNQNIHSENRESWINSEVSFERTTPRSSSVP